MTSSAASPSAPARQRCAGTDTPAIVRTAAPPGGQRGNRSRRTRPTFHGRIKNANFVCVYYF